MNNLITAVCSGKTHLNQILEDTHRHEMVEADNSAVKQQLIDALNSVTFQKVPDTSLWGKPAQTSQKVEDLKNAKGKAFCDNTKQTPAEVKAVTGRAAVDDPENGFQGAKFEDKRTGKAKQYYTDGSFFDGFMFEDNLVKGRFYFPNGDFYQGTFKDNSLAMGQYTTAGDSFKCEQTNF